VRIFNKAKLETTEFMTAERCWILETWNEESDSELSVARVRVERGVTTALHRVRGSIERYLIVSGTGVATIGDLEPRRVVGGDIVVIPDGVSQKISNDGTADLVFYALCTPRFTADRYEALE
jgi:mannose-6-phosphate isomerase-like protein (cupin superfamily)